MTSSRTWLRLAALCVCALCSLPTTASGQAWVLTDSWGGQGTIGAGGFNDLRAVAADPFGNVYAVDANYIEKFIGTGYYLTQWRPLGATTQSTNIFCVATDASGNVFIGEHDSGTIQKFSPTGQFLTEWAVPDAGAGLGDWLAGLAVDATGNVYVANASQRRVMKFSPSGTHLGDLSAPFSQPTGVALDAAGSVYVADYDRVRKFSSAGAPIGEWGSAGSGLGQFGEAFGIAIDRANGFVYVSDAAVPRIQQFGLDGTFVSQWGQPGSPSGAITCPGAVSVGPGGEVFVSDGCDIRIRRYSWTTPPVGVARRSWGRIKSRYR